MNAQSGFGLIALTALVIKRKGRADLGACPRSLVTPVATHGGGRLLSSREAMSISARVSALASLLSGVISFLLLNITAVWPGEIVWTYIDTQTER